MDVAGRYLFGEVWVVLSARLLSWVSGLFCDGNVRFFGVFLRVFLLTFLDACWRVVKRFELLFDC